MTALTEAPRSDSERDHHEGYHVRVAPETKRIRVEFGGATIAESSAVLVMHETRYAPVYYFPREDVRMERLELTDHTTHCPFKGNASYYTVRVGEREAMNGAWSYENPFDEAAIVAGHIAFYFDRMDGWWWDDEPICEPPRVDDKAPPNPFIDWLVDAAWQPKSVPDLLEALALQLARAGFPVWRVRLLIRTLNPQLFAISYAWQRDVAGIAEFQATHAGVQTRQYQDSPFAAIIRGEGGIRRNLEGAGPRLDFPILRDLVAEGATDYVAMPMRFSDGQINILVLVSDAPGGFRTEQLGQLYEILPNLSRLLEAHAQRASSLSLLQTYLGNDAGRKVLDGLVKRGDGEELQAVIWLSDLRESTALADSISRQDYLAALNSYFDCVAGAVIENGGEVLKFIGDAVLAIFAIEAGQDGECQASDRALAAVRDAWHRIGDVNAMRERTGQPPLRFGIGLHRGPVTYGNVGTSGRLDFTVIGPGVNETSRIEALCKTLDQRVLISKEVAAATSAPVVSLGMHTLRGVREPQELFTVE